MSGGSYDYMSYKIGELADKIREKAVPGIDGRALRLAFADLLTDCAEAAHALEWCDSGDSCWESAEPLLREVVTRAMELDAIVQEATRVLGDLSDAIVREEQLRKDCCQCDGV